MCRSGRVAVDLLAVDAVAAVAGLPPFPEIEPLFRVELVEQYVTNPIRTLAKSVKANDRHLGHL